jgi:D-3-phosphoglycerate dehydrogenase
MAAKELIDYIENGNIKNSVNFPNLNLPHTAAHRIVVLHKNIPNTIARITGSLAEQNINIENLANASKGDFAGTIAETNSEIDDAVIEKIAAMDGIVRVIKVS